MTYSALDVARYIINYNNRQGYSISNLRLQKLLYFVQAFFLIHPNKDCVCFSDKIEAWDFGPVVPNVYKEFKHFGSADIPPVNHFVIRDKDNFFDSKVLKYSDATITDQDKILIESVIERFASYTTSEMVELTHCQTPWKQAFEHGKNTEITIGSMRKFFCES